MLQTRRVWLWELQYSVSNGFFFPPKGPQKSKSVIHIWLIWIFGMVRLTPLHSEWPNLFGVLAILNARTNLDIWDSFWRENPSWNKITLDWCKISRVIVKKETPSYSQMNIVFRKIYSYLYIKSCFSFSKAHKIMF